MYNCLILKWSCLMPFSDQSAILSLASLLGTQPAPGSLGSKRETISNISLNDLG